MYNQTKERLNKKKEELYALMECMDNFETLTPIQSIVTAQELFKFGIVSVETDEIRRRALRRYFPTAKSIDCDKYLDTIVQYGVTFSFDYATSEATFGFDEVEDMEAVERFIYKLSNVYHVEQLCLVTKDDALKKIVIEYFQLPS